MEAGSALPLDGGVKCWGGIQCLIRRVTREEVERDKRMILIRIFFFLVVFLIVVWIIFTSGNLSL